MDTAREIAPVMSCALVAAGIGFIIDRSTGVGTYLACPRILAVALPGVVLPAGATPADQQDAGRR